MRCPRSELIDQNEINVLHVMSRTTRRCFLFGDDTLTGKNYDHRKVWIEETLEHFAAQFGIDLLAYAILSNHFHLVLRTRPDVVASWSDQEVASRWLAICPIRRNRDGTPAKPTKKEIRSIAGCPVKLAERRKRLSSVSWWMRLLCQRIATRANREENECGRFFQDRYKATRLIDEASILAASVYVDLNVIRAGIAETIEQSDHTSAQKRAQSLQGELEDSVEPKTKRPPVEQLRPDDFLSPVDLQEAGGEVGPVASASGRRLSDKGFLAMSDADYLSLLDWTARQSRDGKHRTPAEFPPVLGRLGIEASNWLELSGDFGRLFGLVAGRSDRVLKHRSGKRGRRFHLRRRAKELLPPPA